MNFRVWVHFITLLMNFAIQPLCYFLGWLLKLQPVMRSCGTAPAADTDPLVSFLTTKGGILLFLMSPFVGTSSQKLSCCIFKWSSSNKPWKSLVTISSLSQWVNQLSSIQSYIFVLLCHWLSGGLRWRLLFAFIALPEEPSLPTAAWVNLIGYSLYFQGGFMAVPWQYCCKAAGTN